MIPDIDCFTLRLVAYRHNIQTGGYHLSTVVSTRPTNGLFTLAECLLLVHPFNQLTSHVIDFDGDTGRLVQSERKRWCSTGVLTNAGVVT